MTEPQFIEMLRLIGLALATVFWFILRWSLLLTWLAWWLWGVNWRKVWPVLAEGAWAPAVLLILIGAVVWSQVAPGRCDCLGFVSIPNFWWQLGDISMWAATALVCGWLQGVFGWQPPEIQIEPPEGHAPAAHGHH